MYTWLHIVTVFYVYYKHYDAQACLKMYTTGSFKMKEKQPI